MVVISGGGNSLALKRRREILKILMRFLGEHHSTLRSASEFPAVSSK